MSYCAVCPSCQKLKRSAKTSSDGLCDACGGRSDPNSVTFAEWCELNNTTTEEMADAQEDHELNERTF